MGGGPAPQLAHTQLGGAAHWGEATTTPQRDRAVQGAGHNIEQGVGGGVVEGVGGVVEGAGGAVERVGPRC